MYSLESWNPTFPPVMEAISRSELLQQGQVSHITLDTDTLNNAIYESPLLAPFLYCLQILNIASVDAYPTRQVLNVLPYFHELRELTLLGVDVTPIASEVDLPLVHTLQRLSLSHSSLTWMDGLVFTQLYSFTVDEQGWPEIFKRKVGMPVVSQLVCTHIVFSQYTLESLPVLQSDFHLPLLDTFEWVSAWADYDKTGISAFQRIHVKRFKFRIHSTYLGLLELLESKYEVEQLDLVFEVDSAASEVILAKFSAANHVTGRVPCPNAKVLRLQFDCIGGRAHIVNICKTMMNKRRLAGYSLERCCIWWLYEDWEKAASLVLVMENGEVRTEESSLSS